MAVCGDPMANPKCIYRLISGLDKHCYVSSLQATSDELMGTHPAPVYGTSIPGTGG